MAVNFDEVPDKLFYKIGEVCQYTDTQPYVLRFWESEFPQLAPEKNRSGQRVYRRDDIELIFRIKKLLYEEEYTIAGARRRLEQEIAGEPPTIEPGDRAPATPPEPPPAPAPTAADRRLPLDDLLPDDPAESHAPAKAARKGARTGETLQVHEEPPKPPPATDETQALRREIDDLRAALSRAETNFREAEDARHAAEQGKLAAEEAHRTAEAHRDALRAKLRRAAARIEEAIERLGRDAGTRGQ